MNLNPDPGMNRSHVVQTREVTRADLPLSCPMPGAALWNAHPKVYLPIVEEGGRSVCPYCGMHYVLRD